MSEQSSPLHHDTSSAAPATTPARTFPATRPAALSSDWTRALTVGALIGIVVLAGYLRLTHVNWDKTGPGGHSAHLHPDERFLTQIAVDTRAPSSPLNYFDTDTSRLNPYNITRGGGQQQSTFVYGTLPLFMNKFVAANLHVLSLGTLDDYDNYDHYQITGRALAGLLDIGTLLLIFLMAVRLANARVGLLASLLYAVAPFPIQNSHFFIVDPYVTFFAAFSLYFAIRAAQSGGWANAALAGIGAGLAAASKITAISLVPVVLLAIGVRAWPPVQPYLAPLWAGNQAGWRGRRDGHRLDAAVFGAVGLSVVALLGAFIAFRVAMPYAFNAPALDDWFAFRRGHIGPLPFPYPDIMNQHWIADQADQNRLLSGNSSFPPNVQWIGRSKWIWPAQQMIAWGMGPALGITAWLGVAFAAVYAIRRRELIWLVPLVWIAGYFGFMGSRFSLYMRYFLPLYPVLTLFAALLLYHTWRWASSDRMFAALGNAGRRLEAARPGAAIAAKAAVVAVPVMTVLAGFAFYHIYRTGVTRTEASAWIYENVPAGSVIGQEHWDDGLPYSVPGVQQTPYDFRMFKNFEPDTPDKAQTLIDDMDAVDYIVLSSRRLSGTITRVPAEWPVTTRYYQALDSGELGFEKAAEFTSYPEIFGMKFDDTGSEESFTVYDHPKVTVYRKTDAYTTDRARQVLNIDSFFPGFAVPPGQAGQNLVEFRPDVLAKQRAGGTWSKIFDPDSFANDHPVLIWLLTMEVAAFALVPLTFTVFRALPDRGFLLTKPLGLLTLAYLVYGPASYGVIDFTRGWIAIMLALMAAAGVATAALWRRDLVAWLRARWRFLLFAQAVFLLAFAGAYWLRIQNPDLWHPGQGGEKPMDVAYLNGVIRTTDMTQGPIDPWHSGGYLNYYYYGQFISATITKLTGIVPEVAYNLLVPMFFAFAAAAVFSVTYNLAEATRRLMRRRPGRLPIGAGGPILAALFAIFLVMIAGNLKAVGVLETNLDRISPWHSGTPGIGTLVVIAGGFKEIVFGDATLRQVAYTYDWWDPSRAIDVVHPQTEVTPITEFPFWTFLFADLHAHLMAIPFALAAIGVSLAAVLNFTRLYAGDADAPSTPRAREVSSWAMVALLGLIVGSLRWINSWDYPPFLLLAAAALIIGERARDGRLTLRALCYGALKAGVMAALSYGLFAQFAKNYNQAYNGFHRSDQTTELADFLSHFGILLFLVGGFLLVALYRALAHDRLLRGLFFGRNRRRDPEGAALVLAAMTLLAVVLVWFATAERGGVIALTGVSLAAIALLAWREFRSPSPMAPVMLFVYGMAALAFGLAGGVEIYTLDGDIGRMNTVFKFYLHVWLLLGIAGAYGTWYILAILRPHDAVLHRAGALRAALATGPRLAFATGAVALIALALVYPYFGTRARIHNRFDPSQGATNDGFAYMAHATYNDHDERTGLGGEHDLAADRDAIYWMREHVQGSPTIIEGWGPLYHMTSRIAINTGLPSVQGWDWHQSQQRVRFNIAVNQRISDIKEFYATEDADAALNIIKRYDVQYVIVGDVERAYSPKPGIDKFNDGLGGRLELAYANGATQIWHVIPQDELQSAAAAP